MADERNPYLQGQLGIKRMASDVNKQVGAVLDPEIAKAAQGVSPEQLADSEVALRTYLPQVQQKVAAAATDEDAAAIVEEEKRLISERAEIGKRGLSTGERIALAILSSAPLVASAAYGTNFNEATQAAGQIGQGFMNANEAQKNTEIEQVDTELGRLDMRKKGMTKKEEIEAEREFQKERDKTKFGYDLALQNARDKGDYNPEKRQKAVISIADGFRRSQAKEIIKAQSNLMATDKMAELIEQGAATGFTDLSAMMTFVQNLDNSVVRAEDVKNFEQAKGLLLRSSNWWNKMTKGETLGEEGRKALMDVQNMMARASADKLANVVTDKMKKGLKSRGFGDDEIGEIEDITIGGMTPRARLLIDSARGRKEAKAAKENENKGSNLESMSMKDLEAKARELGIDPDGI